MGSGRETDPCLLPLALLVVKGALVVQCLGMPGIERVRLCKGLEGLRRATLLFQGRTQVVPRAVVARVELYGLAVVLDRLGVIPGVTVGQAQVVVGLEILGCQGAGGLAAEDGLFQFAEAPAELAEVPVVEGVVGIEPDRLGIAGEGILPLAGLEGQQGPGMPDAVVVWLGGRQLPVKGVCLGQVAAASQFAGLTQGFVDGHARGDRREYGGADGGWRRRWGIGQHRLTGHATIGCQGQERAVEMVRGGLFETAIVLVGISAGKVNLARHHPGALEKALGGGVGTDVVADELVRGGQDGKAAVQGRLEGDVLPGGRGPKGGTDREGPTGPEAGAADDKVPGDRTQRRRIAWIGIIKNDPAVLIVFRTHFHRRQGRVSLQEAQRMLVKAGQVFVVLVQE